MSVVRSLERDIPTLTDEKITDWADHAAAFGRAADWGQEDIPEVFTNSKQQNSKEEKDYFINKISIV